MIPALPKKWGRGIRARDRRIGESVAELTIGQRYPGKDLRIAFPLAGNIRQISNSSTAFSASAFVIP